MQQPDRRCSRASAVSCAHSARRCRPQGKEVGGAQGREKGGTKRASADRKKAYKEQPKMVTVGLRDGVKDSGWWSLVVDARRGADDARWTNFDQCRRRPFQKLNHSGTRN